MQSVGNDSSIYNTIETIVDNKNEIVYNIKEKQKNLLKQVEEMIKKEEDIWLKQIEEKIQKKMMNNEESKIPVLARKVFEPRKPVKLKGSPYQIPVYIKY